MGTPALGGTSLDGSGEQGTLFGQEAGRQVGAPLAGGEEHPFHLQSGASGGGRGTCWGRASCTDTGHHVREDRLGSSSGGRLAHGAP